MNILCRCQDVLMLLKFLRFSKVIFLQLTKMCFLWLLVRETGIYTTIMAMSLLTLNLILSVI